jgi:hypothetical protein
MPLRRCDNPKCCGKQLERAVGVADGRPLAASTEMLRRCFGEGPLPEPSRSIAEVRMLDDGLPCRDLLIVVAIGRRDRFLKKLLEPQRGPRQGSAAVELGEIVDVLQGDDAGLLVGSLDVWKMFFVLSGQRGDGRVQLVGGVASGRAVTAEEHKHGLESGSVDEQRQVDPCLVSIWTGKTPKRRQPGRRDQWRIGLAINDDPGFCPKGQVASGARQFGWLRDALRP